MRNGFEKVFMGAAGSAGGAGLDVDEVFSTFLYKGNNSSQTITNGIDLDGEGGLWWIKSKTSTGNNLLFDSTRSTNSEHFPLFSNTKAVEQTDFDTTPTSTGFTVNSSSHGNINDFSETYCSWTFRKAPKFFDVVAYTGSGSARTIAHNLGSVPGMIIVKSTDNAHDWAVYHSALGNGTQLNLNTGNAAPTSSSADYWNLTTPTDSVFTLGSQFRVNGANKSYIAYVFAHNDDDGGFGPDGDQDIIKCGEFTGEGSTLVTISLGFEPQFFFVKKKSASDDWYIIDVMRGQPIGANVALLSPNENRAQQDSLIADLNADGLITQNFGSGDYIYMAIRRGTKVPESATEVFAVDAGTTINNLITTGFDVDMAIAKGRNGTSGYLGTRLTGDTKFLLPDTADAEGDYDGWSFDISNGFKQNQIGSNNITYMWKRAPGYFDVVAYTGNGAGVRTVSHNLTVAPEMLWLKRRDGSSPYGDWNVQSRHGISASQYLVLNVTSARTNSPDAWDSTYGTSEVFTVGPDNNVNGFEYVVYLFATLAGVSKAGSVTHSGTTNVDCGFSNGSRFVLVKRYDASGGWYLWDSVRGIVSGNDPYLLLNSTAGEVTNTDLIDPLSSGFTLTSSFTAGDYIFYAIA